MIKVHSVNHGRCDAQIVMRVEHMEEKNKTEKLPEWEVRWCSKAEKTLLSISLCMRMACYGDFVSIPWHPVLFLSGLWPTMRCRHLVNLDGWTRRVTVCKHFRPLDSQGCDLLSGGQHNLPAVNQPHVVETWGLIIIPGEPQWHITLEAL